MAKLILGEAAAAAAASVLTGAIGNAAAGGTERTRAAYSTGPKTSFAPPAWAFPAAWTVNNAMIAWIALQAAKAPAGAPGKRELFALLGTHAALFAAWPLTFVRMQSPMLGAAVTAGDLAVNAAAAYQASKLNRRYAWAFSPVIPWLAYASVLAVVIAAKSDDRVFKVRREGNTARERERIDAQLLRQQELADRQREVHVLHGEDKTVADTFPASDPPQTP